MRTNLIRVQCGATFFLSFPIIPHSQNCSLMSDFLCLSVVNCVHEHEICTSPINLPTLMWQLALCMRVQVVSHALCLQHRDDNATKITCVYFNRIMSIFFFLLNFSLRRKINERKHQRRMIDEHFHVLQRCNPLPVKKRTRAIPSSAVRVDEWGSMLIIDVGQCTETKVLNGQAAGSYAHKYGRIGKKKKKVTHPV